MAIPVGLQLYSLRDLAAKSFYATIYAAADAGYAGVEFAGFFGKPAKEVKKVIADAGLKIFGAHVGPWDLTPDKIDATIAYHLELGNTYLTLPCLTEADRASAEAVKEFAKRAKDEILPKFKKNKLLTGYHTHGFDYKPLMLGKKKTNLVEILLDEMPDTFLLQADVGNTVQGRACPLEYIKKYPGRQHQLHVKEFGRGSFTFPLAAGGEIEWKKIFAASEKAGMKQYIVEIEQYWTDPVECAFQDRAILKALGV